MKNNLLAAISNVALTNPNSQSDPTYVTTVFQGVFNIFIIIGVIYFIWHFIFAGYHFISAQGDEKQYQQAKNEITYALIGLVIIFFVFAILKIIGSILGIQGLDNLQITLPTL
jgi:hypothetical protein